MTTTARSESGRDSRSDGAGLFQFGQWQRAMLESIVLVLLLHGIDAIYFNGTGFEGVSPQPFWIPVLLVTTQYGLIGGVLATVFATVGRYYHGLPSQSAVQDYYAYTSVVVGEPLYWLGTALVLGGLRSLHLFQASETRRQLEEAWIVARDLGDGLERAVAEITRLEVRIAGDEGTLGALGRAFGNFDGEDRVASYAEFCRLLIQARTLAIYQGDEGRLVLRATAQRPGSFAAPPPAGLDGMPPEALLEPGGGLRRANGLGASGMSVWADTVAAIADGHGPVRGLVLAGGLTPATDSKAAADRLSNVARGLGSLLRTGR